MIVSRYVLRIHTRGSKLDDPFNKHLNEDGIYNFSQQSEGLNQEFSFKNLVQEPL